MTTEGTELEADTVVSGQVRTFLIADVRGYTRFSNEHGDEMAARLADRFAVLAREVIALHGGEVTELRGDEALAVFDSPRAAIRAALDLQERFRENVVTHPELPLEVGMGIDAGEALPVQGGYRGGALNLAARLCALAGPGEVFASQGVIHLARKMSGFRFLDRGEVQLKGLTDPAPVVQIAREGSIPQDVTKFTVRAAPRDNLPLQTTPFIGREREVKSIAELLKQQDVRLLTLTGPGGTGKTRLSLRVAMDLIDTFADGIFFVSLAPIRNPDVVSASIATTLGVTEGSERSVDENLAEYLAGKRLLLVLDNFEHLLPASSAVSSLLAKAPHLKVLATSREPLHLSSEQEYPVPPLAVPDPDNLPGIEALSEFEAVQLFIQRARAARPGFTLTDDNGSAVGEICSRLDGLPLAIELAAARVKMFSPEALLARLSSRLKLLTGGARDAPDRQQTLRGTIEWSYRLLSPSEQRLFTRLSVFHGGCTLAAAEEVCTSEEDTDDDALEGMASLIDKSLLRQEGEDETRFAMLETVREYSADKLAEEDAGNEARRDHAKYYLELAERAESELRGPKQAEWLQRLDAEHDNLRAALSWLLEEGSDEAALRLAVSLGLFWHVRAHFGEGRHWVETGLERGGSVSPGTRMKALGCASTLAILQADRERAISAATEQLALARQQNDSANASQALVFLGIAAIHQGESALAVKYLEERLSIVRGLESPADYANTIYSLGLAKSEEGRFSEAIVQIEEALSAFRERGEQFWIANAVGGLAFIALMQGREGDARALLEEYLEMAVQLQDKANIAAGLEGLAALATETGDLRPACRLFACAGSLRAEIGGRLMSQRNSKFVEQRLNSARARLGDDEWARAWEEGKAMSPEQAIDLGPPTSPSDL